MTELDQATQLERRNISAYMEKLGLIGQVSAGIQVDVNAALKSFSDGRFSDAPLCDHNCRTVTDGVVTGSYDCPAARTLNRGLKVKDMAPMDQIIAGIDMAAAGARLANQTFVGEYLDIYFDTFRIPCVVQPVLEKALLQHKIEVNLFGGNPELHPDITDGIRTLREKGYIVNLTTTGGRFLRDSKFLEEIGVHPPHSIAVSADDFASPIEIDTLFQSSLQEIVKLRARIGPNYGQKQKSHEAIYTAKLFPQVLFNMVIHPGNLDRIEETIAALRRNFPAAIVNPFPAQTAFFNGESSFSSHHIPLLEKCIDARISEHFTDNFQLAPRLHYWLMLKSIFLTHRDNPSLIPRCLSGYDSWKCYTTPGANRYLQTGASQVIYDSRKTAGGHLGCYWNPNTFTLTDRQTWDMQPGEVSAFLTSGMMDIARRSSSPCAGCNFPRLNFDIMSTELGMDKALLPAYFKLRHENIGF